MVRKLFKRSFIWVVSGIFNPNGLEVRAVWTWLLLFCSDVMSRMSAKELSPWNHSKNSLILMKIELEALNTFLWQLLKNFQNRTIFCMVFIMRKILKSSRNLSVSEITTLFFWRISIIKFWQKSYQIHDGFEALGIMFKLQWHSRWVLPIQQWRKCNNSKPL